LNTKSIKNKIKSVKNTKKITKAMEMIAAAKMRKAISEASSARQYSRLAADIVATLSKQPQVKHKLMKSAGGTKELIIIIAASRGLCGSYNSNVGNKLKQYLAQEQGQDIIASFEDLDTDNDDDYDASENAQPQTELSWVSDSDSQYDAIAINKKAAQIARRLGIEVVQFYQDFPEKYGYQDIMPILAAAKAALFSGQYHKVSVAYTQFVSSLAQNAEVMQLLPVSYEQLKKFAQVTESAGSLQQDEYAIEPNAGQVTKFALDRIVEVQLLQTLLESSASEHSSRMVAMKNASDAAGDMIDSLTLEYNKSRQAAITQEISEISNAAAAIV
jgi:F-type H+-transporting ATPase subunit gamma